MYSSVFVFLFFLGTIPLYLFTDYSIYCDLFLSNVVTSYNVINVIVNYVLVATLTSTTSVHEPIMYSVMFTKVLFL